MSKTTSIILFFVCYNDVISAPLDYVNPANPDQVQARFGLGFGISSTNGGRTLSFGDGFGSNGGGGGAGAWGAAGSGGSDAYAPQIRIPPGQQWSNQNREPETSAVSNGEGGEAPVEGGGEATVETVNPPAGTQPTRTERSTEGSVGTTENQSAASTTNLTSSQNTGTNPESTANAANSENTGTNPGNTANAAEGGGSSTAASVNSAFGFGPEGGGGVVLNNRGSSGR